MSMKYNFSSMGSNNGDMLKNLKIWHQWNEPNLYIMIRFEGDLEKEMTSHRTVNGNQMTVVIKKEGKIAFLQIFPEDDKMQKLFSYCHNLDMNGDNNCIRMMLVPQTDYKGAVLAKKIKDE